MQVIRTGHRTYRLQYHGVWVCKYRRVILNLDVCDDLKKVLAKLLRRIPGVPIETIGFDRDHLPMVIVIPPKYSIADVMGKLKSQSASRVKKAFSLVRQSVLERKYCVLARLVRQ